ncbi:hypothetical protein IF2G_03849 [Cordyceps javanica]|nr:hypothetical protein IF2G_03849 [Cordyceps javanica]
MEKARDKADKNSCKINKLFVTFPSTWRCWMEKYFVACFDIVWKLEIELIHESEAIVNFITSRSNLYGLRNATTGLIVVDFGVDMLNLSTICLASRETDPTKFHLVVKGQDVSEHSGVHLHAKLVKRRIKNYIDANRHDIPKSEELKIHNEFMTSYTHNYKAMVIGDAFEICATSSSGVPHQISFDKEDSQKMYDQCFLDAFTSLEKYLDDIRSEDGLENTKVVLVGVGFRNRSIWKEVKKRAESRGLALQDSTSFAIDITQPTCVALGAAYAISNPVTIREFMQTASFAVQSTERAPNLDQVIWSRGSSRTARISVLEGCDQRIICSPAPKAGENNTEKNLFYDFSTLALAGGEYDLRMDFRGDSIIIYCKDTRGQANNGDDEDQFEYKIYSDPGSRVCLRDIDKDASCGKDDRVEPDLNVPRALRSVTRETLKARILERTKYPDLDSGFPVTPGPSASAVSSRLRKR